MTYKIILHKKVVKFLDTHSSLAAAFFRKAKIMQTNPFDRQLDIKKYNDPSGTNYRLRIGTYRFLYTIIERDVVIYFFQAGNRGDIY